MIGILTEKPSAKKNFMKALGGERGNYNGEEFIIVNALGHLYQLKNPAQQVDKHLINKYKSWDLNNLPWRYEDMNWDYAVSKGGQKYLSEIKSKLSKCDEIIIATDIDPTGEGDLLAGEIILNLNLDKKKLSRMEFIDESAKSLQKAFVNRRLIPDLEKDLNYQKALFRSKWDFMSMQFTRIATNLSPIEGVLRQGRLKSAMVNLTGEALEELANYKKVPYFENRFIDENKVIYSNPSIEKYGDKSLVPSNYKASKIILDSKTIKRTAPPKLIDLAMLSSRLAPKGYSSKEVLATYQKMYQEEYLSYPRTADKNITHEQFREMLPIAKDIAKLLNIDTNLLTHNEPRSTHVKDIGSHGANRPGIKVPKDLNHLSRFGRAAIPIYTLLAKNYLAMLCEDYEYENQVGHISDYPEFKGSTNIPKSLGWKEVYDTDDIDEEENISSGLGSLGKPFIHQGYPKAPPTPTMGWLMKQLEKNNVGNGSTRTSTYTEVVNQDYKYPLMISNKGKLSMTPFGEISYKLLKGTKIGDVNITESVLNTMDNIGNGDTHLIESKLKELEGLVKHDLAVMKENSKGVGKPVYQAVEKKVMKNNKGKEISFKKEWGGHKFTQVELSKLSAGETIVIKGLKSKKGKIYTAVGSLQEQEFKGNKFWGFKMTEYIEEE